MKNEQFVRRLSSLFLFLLFVVSALLNPGLFTLHFQFTSFKKIFPLDGEKNTESECQMQSVGRKKKEILGRFELHFCMIELKVD